MSKQVSNVKRGEKFTKRVKEYFQKCKGYCLKEQCGVPIGNKGTEKYHKFDLANESILVECKSYSWTGGNNSPSAKFSTANEAILYFIAAPARFERKLLFMRKTNKVNNRNAAKDGLETLAEQYVRRYKHFFPSKFEVWELDDKCLFATRLYPPETEA